MRRAGRARERGATYQEQLATDSSRPNGLVVRPCGQSGGGSRDQLRGGRQLCAVLRCQRLHLRAVVDRGVRGVDPSWAEGDCDASNGADGEPSQREAGGDECGVVILDGLPDQGEPRPSPGRPTGSWGLLRSERFGGFDSLDAFRTWAAFYVGYERTYHEGCTLGALASEIIKTDLDNTCRDAAQIDEPPAGRFGETAEARSDRQSTAPLWPSSAGSVPSCGMVGGPDRRSAGPPRGARTLGVTCRCRRGRRWSLRSRARRGCAGRPCPHLR